MHISSLPVVASSYIYAVMSDSACNKDIKPTLGLPTRQQIRADGHATCRVSREARHRAHFLTKPHNINLSCSRAPINNIKKSSCYLTENTVRLHYKYEPLTTVRYENHTKHRGGQFFFVCQLKQAPQAMVLYQCQTEASKL
jgi:hypothetical protein